MKSPYLNGHSHGIRTIVYHEHKYVQVKLFNLRYVKPTFYIPMVGYLAPTSWFDVQDGLQPFYLQLKLLCTNDLVMADKFAPESINAVMGTSSTLTRDSLGVPISRTRRIRVMVLWPWNCIYSRPPLPPWLWKLLLVSGVLLCLGKGCTLQSHLPMQVSPFNTALNGFPVWAVT